MNSEQLEQQEMEKLASAASLVKELAEGHGIDIDNITEEEAENLLGMAYEALHGVEDDGGEKTASVVVKELSQSEEGMSKLAAAGEVVTGARTHDGERLVLPLTAGGRATIHITRHSARNRSCSLIVRPPLLCGY